MRYTKLFSSIIHSSIWVASNETRIVWITMLAMADGYGNVEASVIGLAKAANLEWREVVKALEELSSEDQWSRSKEFGGRRIEEIEGGWHILNYSFYRRKMSAEHRAEQNRERQRRYRERNAQSVTVTDRYEKSRHIEKEKEKERDKNRVRESIVPNKKEAVSKQPNSEKKQLSKSGATAPRYSADFESWWYHYPKKTGKLGASKAFERLRRTKGFPSTSQMVIKLEKQKQTRQWKDGYIPNPLTYLNQGRWEDEVTDNDVKAPESYSERRNRELSEMIARAKERDEKASEGIS